MILFTKRKDKKIDLMNRPVVLADDGPLTGYEVVCVHATVDPNHFGLVTSLQPDPLQRGEAHPVSVAPE